MKAWALGIVALTAAALGYLLAAPGGVNVAGDANSMAFGADVFYWTDPGLDPDPCVAAWLLTRYVTPGARVLIRTESPDGTPFDMPGCKLGREPGSSTSDVVIQTYGIDDPFAAALASVVRELELKPWTTNDEEFFVRVRSGLADALNATDSDEACLMAAMTFLDKLRAQEPTLPPPLRDAP